MSFKSPLNIYVVWHPNFIEGKALANTIFSTFNRKVTEPLSRGPGIPVFFRSLPVMANVPLELDFDESEYSVVVFLIDNAMTISADWHSYINKTIARNVDKILFLPVAITKEAFNIPADFGKMNFIRLYNLTGTEKEQSLLLSITHEICRLLYSPASVPSTPITGTSPAPIKIFLSHSKHDKCGKGEKLALTIKDSIYTVTPMKAFFDVNDIAPGYDFESEIVGNIEKMVFLCIHTDTYAKREYCRKEIIAAKNYKRPIVVLNALDNGEDRSFPYMSNVPTININIDMGACPIISKSETAFVLLKILLETMRFKFQEMFLCNILTIFKPGPNNKIETVPFPPELFYINNIISSKPDTIVYPDPPLGEEEIKVLDQLNTKVGYNCDYITPTLLPLKFI
jgi:hypothetical protein